MTRSLVALMLLMVSTVVQAQDRWIHLSGVSWHDQPGYNQHNWGVGLERRVIERWTLSAGVYRNSLDRTGVYGLARYHWSQSGPIGVNIMMGAATGYDIKPLAPVFLPEICLNWLCGFVAPAVGPNTTTALALYLRIPID